MIRSRQYPHPISRLRFMQQHLSNQGRCRCRLQDAAQTPRAGSFRYLEDIRNLIHDSITVAKAATLGQNEDAGVHAGIQAHQPQWGCGRGLMQEVKGLVSEELEADKSEFEAEMHFLYLRGATSQMLAAFSAWPCASSGPKGNPVLQSAILRFQVAGRNSDCGLRYLARRRGRLPGTEERVLVVGCSPQRVVPDARVPVRTRDSGASVGGGLESFRGRHQSLVTVRVDLRASLGE